MIKLYRPVLFLFCLLLAACNDSSPAPSVSTPDPAKSAAKPLPNIDDLVKRLITQDGSKDFTAEMRMTAEKADGKRDQIEFRVQRKYSEDGASTLLTVLAPKEETDKAILTREQAAKPTEAFSYLAGLRKLTKLDSSRQLGFRGAKVTVQELLGMELGQYTHDAGKRETVDGEPLIKVEFRQKTDLGLAFPRIVAYFREADQSPARFDLYGDSGELSKKVTIEEVKNIQDHQTVTKIAIEDLGQKLNIKLETRKIEYDKGLSDKIFTEGNLKTLVTSASQKLDASK